MIAGALPGASCAREWSNSAIVQAQLEWSIPSPDNRVEWELWTTSIDESSMDFLTDFKSTALALGLHQEFTPHFYTYNGTAYGCTLEDANLCDTPRLLLLLYTVYFPRESAYIQRERERERERESFLWRVCVLEDPLSAGAATCARTAGGTARRPTRVSIWNSLWNVEEWLRDVRRELETISRALTIFSTFRVALQKTLHRVQLGKCWKRRYFVESRNANIATRTRRYCAPDPDGSRNQGISGADVVRENLRRTCLWKLEGGKDQMDASQVGVGETWWDYVGNFSELCGTLEGFNDPDCVSRAMSAAGVDFARVEDCMQSSGGVDADVPNTMLEHELGELKSKSVYVVPECIVNGAVIWGALSVSNVLETICHGYSHGDQPKACQCVDTAGTAGDERYANCLSDSGDNAHSGTSGQKSVVQSGMPWWGVFLLFVSIIVVMLLAGLAYWKKTQQQMRDQVRGILAEYMPLEDLGPTSTPGGNHDRTNIQA